MLDLTALAKTFVRNHVWLVNEYIFGLEKLTYHKKLDLLPT